MASLFLTPIALLPILSGVLLLLLAVPVWPHRHKSTACAFLILLLSTAVWSFAYAGELCSTNLDTAVFFANIQYFGIPATPAAFFAIVLLLYGGAHRNSGIWFVLVLHSILMWGVTWSDSSFHLLRNNVQFMWSSDFWAISFTRGPAFVANVVISYTFLTTSVLMLGQLAQGPNALARKQAQVLLFGLALPVMANVARLLGFEPIRGFDPTPVMYSMSAVTIAYGLFKWSLISVAPIARSQVFDGVSDPVVVLDPDGRVVDANPAAARLFHLGEVELARTTVSDLSKIIPIDLGMPEGSIVVSEGREYILRQTQLESGLEPSIGLILQFTDITDTRRVEAELRNARDVAEHANAAKSRFVANVSHELRTPLTGVAGLTDLLAKTPLNPKQQDYLVGIRQCAETLLSLISDVLDLSKLDADSMPISRDRLDLHAVVEEVSAIHRHLIAGAKLELVTVYDIPEECYVWGDPLRIRQVLHNLIGNAVKFTELGTVRVTVSRDLTGEYLISVADTGIGIPAERQSAVFEDFEQADASTTRSFGGTGLGLPITRRLVERMGGTLTLESRLGEGTTITVRIRLAESPSPQAAVAEDEVPNGLSILLAEDNELNALVITEQLLEFGCSVERCANGISALELYGDTAFDLVLLDIQMPLMDGLAVTRVMRERWPDRKTLIYALTANAFVDERDRASEAGMDGFVTKPMRREDLIALLQSVAQKIAEPR